MITPIKPAKRERLVPLFEGCRYDRVLIDSILEGHFGDAYADCMNGPTVARLDSGAFTMLGGNPSADDVQELLLRAPVYYVTPQDDGWRQKLLDVFASRISKLTFIDFLSTSLDPRRLTQLVRVLPPGYELKRIDKLLAKQLPSDIGNEYFFENFHTVDDFLERGIGYCILHQDKIASAATSMAQCSKAIDIEIETAAEYRGRGLGTVVGAQLVSHCLEQGIEPRWLANNIASEKLALKLGYSRGETYETFEIRG